MKRAEIEAGAVGAWVIKCDPIQIWDIGHVASALWDNQKRRPVTGISGEWSLAPTYRAAVIAPGDRCFFWVSGDVDTWESGLWGECKILGHTTDGRGGGRAWIDLAKKREVVPYLPVRWRFLARPIPKALVRHDRRLANSELVKVPRMSNPVALTKAEASVLDNMIQRRRKQPKPGSRK